MNSQVHLENVRSGKEKVGTSFLHSGYGSLVADVGIPGYGLGSSSVCDGSYSSHGVGFADIVLFVGKRSPRKEKAVVLDFQNSAVSLPSGKHTTSLSSFHSGFGKGQMVLDFENSAVRLSSAKEDMFNDGGWFGLDVVTRFYRDDPYRYMNLSDCVRLGLSSYVVLDSIISSLFPTYVLS
ncbi:hypothetical protein Tco_0121626 [Tanacetum coccineum]